MTFTSRATAIAATLAVIIAIAAALIGPEVVTEKRVNLVFPTPSTVASSTTTSTSTSTTTTEPPPPVTTTLAPPAPAPQPTAREFPASTVDVGAFLACVRQREGGGDYSINTGNGYFGTYQFLQSTWDNTARHAGRDDLVGVHPSDASPADQDAMALALYAWQGAAPWAGGNYSC